MPHVCVHCSVSYRAVFNDWRILNDTVNIMILNYTSEDKIIGNVIKMFKLGFKKLCAIIYILQSLHTVNSYFVLLTFTTAFLCTSDKCVICYIFETCDQMDPCKTYLS